MSKNTTIKISKKTLERLHRIVGELTYKKGQRVILEEAVTFFTGEIRARFPEFTGTN